MSSGQPNILILRLSSIGDILLTTPFIRQVRNTFPEANISYIVKKEFASLLKFNPHIDRIIEFNASEKYKGLLGLRKKLQKEQFDYIFDLHNNLRTNRLTRNFKAATSRIKKNKIKRAALVYLKMNLYDGVKAIPEKYLDVGSVAGIKDTGEKLELFTGETRNQVNPNDYGLTENKYICLAPGAAHKTKMWPIENVHKLIQKITDETEYKIAILGSLKEKELFQPLQENKNVVHLEGRLNLLGSAQILQKSLGIICNDSGLMHMAAALKKPVIAIFGSTVKELGFFPYRADSTIIENENLWCRPCSHIGREKCPLKHFKCMKAITVERVFNEFMRKFLKQ